METVVINRVERWLGFASKVAYASTKLYILKESYNLFNNSESRTQFWPDDVIVVYVNILKEFSPPPPSE